MNFFSKFLPVSSKLDSFSQKLFFKSDLGPNCLQRLSAGDLSHRLVKMYVFFLFCFSISKCLQLQIKISTLRVRVKNKTKTVLLLV